MHIVPHIWIEGGGDVIARRMRRAACARETDLRDWIGSIKRERGKHITRSISSVVKKKSKFHFSANELPPLFLCANCSIQSIHTRHRKDANGGQSAPSWEVKKYNKGKWSYLMMTPCCSKVKLSMLENCKLRAAQKDTSCCFRQEPNLLWRLQMLFPSRPSDSEQQTGRSQQFIQSKGWNPPASFPHNAWAQEFFQSPHTPHTRTHKPRSSGTAMTVSGHKWAADALATGGRNRKPAERISFFFF